MLSRLPLSLCVILFLSNVASPRLAAQTVPASGNLPLAESERQYLADIEHRALTLAKRGFPAIKAAIREADRDKLSRIFADTFQGETLDFGKGESPDLPWLELRRVEKYSARVKPMPATRQAMVDYLVGLRERFERAPELEMKLLDFAPVKREELQGAWKGVAQLRYAGKYRNGHTAEIFFKCQIHFARIADVDEITADAGWIDGWKIFEGYESTVPKPLLEETAAERGLDRELFWDNWKRSPEESTVVSGGVYLADIDDDGRDDVLITDINGLFLFRTTEDGKFEDITEKAGLSRGIRAAVNAVFGDFDGDALPDLIVDNRVFRNAGGRFQEVTAQSNLRFGNIRYLSGYSVGDYNNDGLLDIYVARSHGPQGRYGKNSWLDGPGGPGNQLWRNLGNWKFEDVSDSANARAGRRSVFTAAWLDANNDLFPDIYVINEFGGGVLLVNQKNGTFKEQVLTKGPGDFGSMGLITGDVNNDGHIDIYTANMYSKSGRRIVGNLIDAAYPPDVMAKMKTFFPGSQLYRNRGGLQFEPAGEALHVRAVGWAYGPILVDLNNDGFLDIYATSGFVSFNKEEPDG